MFLTCHFLEDLSKLFSPLEYSTYGTTKTSLKGYIWPLPNLKAFLPMAGDYETWLLLELRVARLVEIVDAGANTSCHTHKPISFYFFLFCEQNLWYSFVGKGGSCFFHVPLTSNSLHSFPWLFLKTCAKCVACLCHPPFLASFRGKKSLKLGQKTFAFVVIM